MLQLYVLYSEYIPVLTKIRQGSLLGVVKLGFFFSFDISSLMFY